jgi:hypothetical protein
LKYGYLVWQSLCGVELYIDRGGGTEAWNKAVFDYLHARRGEIEARYGGPLRWYRLDQRRACRIMEEGVEGGIRTPPQEWPAAHAKLVDAMARFETAVGPHLAGAVAAAANELAGEAGRPSETGESG